MFEETEPEKSGIAKALTFFAIGMGVCLGSCAIGGVTGISRWGAVFTGVMIFSGIIFCVCLIGFVITIVVWVIKQIVEFFQT